MLILHKNSILVTLKSEFSCGKTERSKEKYPYKNYFFTMKFKDFLNFINISFNNICFADYMPICLKL